MESAEGLRGLTRGKPQGPRIPRRRDCPCSIRRGSIRHFCEQDCFECEQGHHHTRLMDIDDPLKPLADVYRADARRSAFVGRLANELEELASISLHAGVPDDVRQDSKNVSLYHGSSTDSTL